jgi:acetamidase/formamidase
VTRHRLDPTPDTVVDVFDPARSPVLEVAAGDTLVVRSLDASGYLAPMPSPGARGATMFAEPRGHCLTGPIAVAGAQPGSVLAVHLVSMTPDPWGWTVAAALDNDLNRRLGVVPGEPAWLLWDIDVENGRATNQLGTGVALAPFLGVTGVAPAEPGEHSTIPPRAQGGGNIDCRELVAGSTLYLPVQVPGALLSLGDGHAAQGDGEVGGTAVECPMTTELVVEVLPDRPVPGIHALTPAGRITFGFDADLNEATAEALAAMLTWLQSSYGVDRPTALALASAAVHLRVTQVANQVWGVHALLPHGALR